MLIEFKMANFRSFKDNQLLSMVAASFPEHRENNTFDPEIKSFDERLLRSASIYGANASGKTNVLRALQFMQLFILNSAAITTGIQSSPFKFSHSSRNSPSEFEITFIQNDIRYEYGFVLNSDRVEKEWLTEFVTSKGRAMYERVYNKKKAEYVWKFSTFLKGKRSLWSESTRSNALFLSTAAQLNSQQLIPIFEWFQKRLVVIVGETKLNASLTLNLLEEPNGKDKLLSFLQEADLGITDVEVKRIPLAPGITLQGNQIIERSNQNSLNLVEIKLSHFSDDTNHASLDLPEESNGTQTIFKSAGAWINVFKNGEVLLVDEIESSFHPLLVRWLVRKFHSKENKHNSQLIFTTHSPELLDHDLMRRDQIWFVEKDKFGSSKIYPLTDFKPRNDEVIQRWYMRGRYGALPIIN